MLTQEENNFILFWEDNRLNNKVNFFQFIKGLSRGLAISLAIIALVISGWYQRANMQANAKLSTGVFIVALALIAIFMAWLYKNFQWESNEQKYLELIAKKEKIKKEAAINY